MSFVGWSKRVALSTGRGGKFKKNWLNLAREQSFWIFDSVTDDFSPLQFRLLPSLRFRSTSFNWLRWGQFCFMLGRGFINLWFRSRVTTWQITNNHISSLHFIYYWNPPWQAATVPSPVGKISLLGWWHGIHLPIVSTWNNPYLIVTRYFAQLIKPSPHEQLKQTPENQWVPCSRTMPFSSVQAGRESLVQVIFP